MVRGVNEVLSVFIYSSTANEIGPSMEIVFLEFPDLHVNINVRIFTFSVTTFLRLSARPFAIYFLVREGTIPLPSVRLRKRLLTMTKFAL